jgi:HSP20 family protein
MSLIPQNKSAVVRSFNNEFQRLFDRFFDTDHDIKRTLSSFDWVPSVDVVEKEKIYLVKVNLPGVDPKDVDIQAEDGMLTIRGERKEEKSEDRNGQHLTESSYGSFYRSFSLPNGVGIDDIKASSKNGVVEIEIPKGKNSMPKKIQINH